MSIEPVSSVNSLQAGLTLRASISLSEVYGPGVVFNGYVHPRFDQWLTRDSVSSPAYAARVLPIAGEMPVLCYRPTVRPEILALMREAGLELSSDIHLFDDHRGYLEQLRRLAGAGWRFVHQYVQPADEVDPASYWVDRTLLARLNNKCELGNLVPAEYAPRRQLMAPVELAADTLPCVIKACTDQPSGMGMDVRLCDSDRDLEAARRYFRDCDRVVVEERLNIATNLCLNYAVLGPSDIRYLGAAEQIVDDDGYFLGNWIAPEIEAPQAAQHAGEAIVRRAAIEGYRGIVGVDAAMLADGQVRIYDLNFRLNNSTFPLLLRAAITARFGTTVMQAVSLKMMVPLERMLPVARAAVERGHLLPLWILGGSNGPDSRESECRLKGVVLGDNRAEVADRLQRLFDEGFRVRARIG